MEYNKDLYDKINITKQNILHENIPKLKDMIDKYVKENVKFICELPSLIGIEDEKDPGKVKNPYKQVPICPVANLNIEQIVEDIVECCG